MQSAADMIADQWGLSLLSHVADAGHAQVWKAQTANGPAALKLYRNADRGNEAAGTKILRLWQDRGAVQILAETQDAVLMEWLEGPSLGDLARTGDLNAALTGLAEAARRLHQTPVARSKGLRSLQQVFDPLFFCQFSTSCTPSLQQNMIRAIELARTLLDSQPDTVPLHGDLHPDNIIRTPAGDRVFDAKGYLGDPAFELANALRHPKGMAALVRQCSQIERCMMLYASAMNVDHQRLARWAAAKCALSIFWRADGPVETDREADLLHRLLKITDQ